jgi:hypothetical protein
MRENMCDEIREWFVACRDQTGSFPDFPDAEAGGSKKIFDPPPPPPAVAVEDDDGGKGKKGKGKKDKGKKGKGKGKGKKGKGGDEDEGPAPFPKSEFETLTQEGSNQYRKVWQDNKVGVASPNPHVRSAERPCSTHTCGVLRGCCLAQHTRP